MSINIIYRPNSETSSAAEAYANQFEREFSAQIKLIDQDSKDGIRFSQLYDIMQFPALVVVQEDGALVNMWTDRDKWPTLSELSFYSQ